MAAVTERRLTAAAAVAVLALAGCTADRVNRLLYDVGDQYACTRDNVAHPSREAADAACADPAHPRRSRYEDYREARESSQ